jgi:hypothetical protein
MRKMLQNEGLSAEEREDLMNQAIEMNAHQLALIKHE